MSSSYIGRSVDAINNISTLDNLSFNGSDATFNLTQNSVAFVPVSADALQIQIDGVIQSGNYTVSGSTVTFDFTPSGSSVCNGIRHFGVGLLTTVSDSSITTAKLGADSVNGSKIADNSISDEHLDNTAITGQTAITSLADTDKFLVSDASDSGNLKYIENQYLGGGTLVPLAQIESTSDASVIALDSFMDASTYTGYKVFFAGKSGGNGNVLQARFRDDGGALGASLYDFVNISRYHNADDNQSGNGENHADIVSDGSTNTIFIEFTIFPNGGVGNQGTSICFWQSADRKYNGNSRRPRVVVGAFQFIHASIPDGFQIENTTANFEDYEMHAYGIKKS